MNIKHKELYNKSKIRNDIILIVLLCIVAGIACFFLYFKDNNKNMQLQILIDGVLVATYDYNAHESLEEPIKLDTGNTIVVENGHVFMDSADCPDGLCIKQGKISSEGEAIICLPHKLVVRIAYVEDESDREADDGLDVMPR